MQVVPTARRALVHVLPALFTSSVYVQQVKDDLLALFVLFGQSYSFLQSQPFATFKDVWRSQGWHWLHTRYFDDRTRDSMLRTTMRIMLEFISDKEPPLHRILALYAFYTFYNTQPVIEAPLLITVNYIPVTLDFCDYLADLPSTLTTEELTPFLPTVTYIISSLFRSRVFYLLPRSSLLPLNPRYLPRETLDGEQDEVSSQKKLGRPTKQDKIKKTRDSVSRLDAWLNLNTVAQPHQEKDIDLVPVHAKLLQQPDSDNIAYQNSKAALLHRLGYDSEILRKINQDTLSQMKRVEEDAAENGLEIGGAGGSITALERVELAVSSDAFLTKGGVLGLLEGAGLTET